MAVGCKIRQDADLSNQQGSPVHACTRLRHLVQSMLPPRLLLLLCLKPTPTCADVARQSIVAEREREGREGAAASQQRSPVHVQVFKASRCGHIAPTL